MELRSLFIHRFASIFHRDLYALICYEAKAFYSIFMWILSSSESRQCFSLNLDISGCANKWILMGYQIVIYYKAFHLYHSISLQLQIQLKAALCIKLCSILLLRVLILKSLISPISFCIEKLEFQIWGYHKVKRITYLLRNAISTFHFILWLYKLIDDKR